MTIQVIKVSNFRDKYSRNMNIESQVSISNLQMPYRDAYALVKTSSGKTLKPTEEINHWN